MRLWPFKRKKKIDSAGAIVLTPKEYQTLVDLNASDPRVRWILDAKGITLGDKTVKVTVGGETFFMSATIEKLGTKMLD